MTHTPGPWTFVRGAIEAPGLVLIARVARGKATTDLHTFELDGNGHLLAAAPELLDALDSLTEAAKEALIKGSDEICQLPMCGEAGGHVGWCPISIAQECLDAIKRS